MAKTNKSKLTAETNNVKPCFIKMLPKPLWEAASVTAIAHNPTNMPALSQFTRATGEKLSTAYLSVLTTKYWRTNGVRLTVGFIDTTSIALRRKILSHMNAWGNYCDVKFTFSKNNPQVRIAFSSDPNEGGYWSYLGTDILHIDDDKPTMNLDSFTINTAESEFTRVVRHETGHTLGFPHEHMRSEIIKKIDKEKAIQLFMATQGWSRQEVINQVLTPLPNSALIASEDADPNSIMCYQLPGSIMKDGVGILGGKDIDVIDQKFAALIYPKKK